jgi:hypothetical protein
MYEQVGSSMCPVASFLERQTFGTPRMYMFSPLKSIKGSNYGEFLKDKNVLLCT